MVFGLALEKGRVFEPRSIRGQFIYQIWIMMKMFLSAVASGLICLGILSIIPCTKKAFDMARDEYTSCLTRKGLVTTCLGGMLLGGGMAMSGACPGMVLSQVGAWVGQGSGLMTFVGCLFGSFVYGVFEPGISHVLAPSTPYKKQLVDHYVTRIPFFVMAFVFAFMLIVLILVLELLKPWRTELDPTVIIQDASWFFQLYAWPPYVAGILIGCLQLPLVLIVGDTLGGSSSYCTISSQVLVSKKLEELAPYLAKFKRGISAWWQVFFVCGAILGALFSALASDTLGTVPGCSYLTSFFGGFIMLFGARLAGGCTSGHGLSGMGVLAVLSFIAVAFMFIGGTIVGFSLWAISPDRYMQVQEGYTHFL